VRVTVETSTDPEVLVVLTRAQAREAAVGLGDGVWCAPVRGAQTVPVMSAVNGSAPAPELAGSQ